MPTPPPSDTDIAQALLALIAARSADATVCPSDVARHLAPDGAAWRPLMPRIRAVAARLAEQGRVRVTRRGVEVDATAPGGPIRIGRATGDD